MKNKNKQVSKKPKIKKMTRRSELKPIIFNHDKLSGYVEDLLQTELFVEFDKSNEIFLENDPEYAMNRLDLFLEEHIEYIDSFLDKCLEK
jgi:hypothetical protein